MEVYDDEDADDDLTSVTLRSFLSLQSSVALNTSGSFGSGFSCFALMEAEGFDNVQVEEFKTAARLN